jgi:hypothetical protein
MLYGILTIGCQEVVCVSVRSNLRHLVGVELQRLASERLGYSTPGKDGTWERSLGYLMIEYKVTYREYLDVTRDLKLWTVLELQNSLAILKVMSWNRIPQEEEKE